jgi:predicted ATPase
MSGYPDDAVTRIEDALAGARKVSHPYTLELILYHRALLRQLRRESHLAQPLAEEAYAFADEYGFTLIGEAAAVIVGWAIAMQGQTAHGIAHIERALDRHKSSGANIVAWHLAMLAEAHVRNGTYRVAMDIIGKGLAFAQKSGERMGEAELYRIKGELLRKQGEPNHIEAQTCFRRAVKTAREQGAKWWELRATTSLAKLWRDQGKPEKAHALLAPIHTWFTEGAGTPDQVEAESLLHELAALADPKRSISGVAAS